MKRKKIIPIRFSDEEWHRIKLWASRNNLYTSTLIRKIILDMVGKKRRR